MKFVIILIATILSAILYRLGGSAKKGDWLDILRNTKTRDLGCPLVALLVLLMFGIHAQWYIHLIAFLLMFGACTTYWDWLFGYDNFYAHGLAIGLAYLPYLLIIPWYLILARAVIMSLFMGFWCNYFTSDIIEEGGRGAIITATLPILLI